MSDAFQGRPICFEAFDAKGNAIEKFEFESEIGISRVGQEFFVTVPVHQRCVGRVVEVLQNPAGKMKAILRIEEF